ncbi:uncharacterized protein [Delphinus delphis]|uniref:uncharacterized protein n=1 Tax=Delphinus delphis TaxID=9728 RepID=UPI0028C4DA99|nr:uncharacterized protein LOC132413049 [Delphinus delphis]
MHFKRHRRGSNHRERKGQPRTEVADYRSADNRLMISMPSAPRPPPSRLLTDDPHPLLTSGCGVGGISHPPVPGSSTLRNRSRVNNTRPPRQDTTRAFRNRKAESEFTSSKQRPQNSQSRSLGRGLIVTNAQGPKNGVGPSARARRGNLTLARREQDRRTPGETRATREWPGGHVMGCKLDTQRDEMPIMRHGIFFETIGK